MHTPVLEAYGRLIYCTRCVASCEGLAQTLWTARNLRRLHIDY